jgi:hypothetical protein
MEFRRGGYVEQAAHSSLQQLFLFIVVVYCL